MPLDFYVLVFSVDSIDLKDELAGFSNEWELDHDFLGLFPCSE
jgi:hypothetical protein